MNTKDVVLFKEIISKHLPEFRDPYFVSRVLDISKNYNTFVRTETLVEHALAKVGGYNFVNKSGYDFDDVNYSDSKTLSVNARTLKAELSGISSKVGSLRITIYNPIKASLDYMYIPQTHWVALASKCYGKNKNGELRLIMKWSQATDSYNRFEPYRLTTFCDLATMSDTKFYSLKYSKLFNEIKANIVS